MGKRIQGMLALVSGNSDPGDKKDSISENEQGRVHTDQVDVGTEANADG